MPKIIDHDEQRNRIRQAALNVLKRDGTFGGLGRIASEAGMKRANLYTYYATRQELLDDVASNLLDAEAQLFAAMLNAEGTEVERVLHFVDSVCSRFSDWSLMGSSILQIWARDPQRIQQLISNLRQDLVQMIKTIHQQRQTTCRYPPIQSATLIIALIDGLMLQIFLDPKGMPTAEALHELLSESIGVLLGIKMSAKSVRHERLSNE